LRRSFNAGREHAVFHDAGLQEPRDDPQQVGIGDAVLQKAQ
jgi:hypothetical protein